MDDRGDDRDGDWRRPRRVERRRRSASQSSDDEFVPRGRARGGDSAAAAAGGASSDRRRGRRSRDRSRSRDRDRDRRVRRRSRSRTLSPPRVRRDDRARHPRDARPRSRDRDRSRDASRDRHGVARPSPIEHRTFGAPRHLQPRRSYGRTADIPRPVRRGSVPSAPAPPGPDDQPAVVDPAADLPGVPIPRWFDASPGTGAGTGTGTGSTGNAARWGSYAASAEGFGREILDFIAFVQPDAAELRARYAALTRLETAGAEVIPAARAEPFGATAQRLLTHRGGLDARVRSSNANDATPECRGLERLTKALSARPWATDVSSSSSNRMVPSVSYVDVPTGLRVRACVGNRQTFRGTNFFDSPMMPLASRFPLWRPLMLPLKCFFEQRGLRAPFDGGLGAFRLGMMLLDYLSVHAPASTAPATPAALGSALIGFFRFYAGESPDEDAPGAAAWQRWRENFRFDPRGMHVMGVHVDFGGCAAPDVARAFAAATRAAAGFRVGVPSSSTALSRLLDEFAVADGREVTRTAARRVENALDFDSNAVTLPEAFLPVARWIEPTTSDANADADADAGETATRPLRDDETNRDEKSVGGGETEIPNEDAGFGVRVGGRPTARIVLKNMFDPSEARGDARFFRDIAEDARDECGKHGEVLDVVVDERSQGFVRVAFHSAEVAARAKAALHARWFGGRLVTCHFEH